MHPQINTLRRTTSTSFYPYTFLLFTALYLAINIWTNKIYISGTFLFHYHWSISYPYATLTLLNALLVGLNANLLIDRTRQYRNMGTAGTLSGLGAATGLLAGACPGCIVGVFPLILGIFGSTYALSDLPLAGIEILLLSAILLATGAHYLSQPLTCKPRRKP
ncbi:MAG: hypothetical protein HC945_00485 [Nitrosarchaeum sp.]|nr:hypothetical protein [Nitrosarchaeum sp.]